jgi:hypothetical protein
MAEPDHDRRDECEAVRAFVGDQDAEMIDSGTRRFDAEILIRDWQSLSSIQMRTASDLGGSRCSGSKLRSVCRWRSHTRSARL